jgi:hypothetical protein
MIEKIKISKNTNVNITYIRQIGSLIIQNVVQTIQDAAPRAVIIIKTNRKRISE